MIACSETEKSANVNILCLIGLGLSKLELETMQLDETNTFVPLVF